MTQPLTAPWLLRFSDQHLEVRLLVADASEGQLSLAWREEESGPPRSFQPLATLPTRLGTAVRLVRFAIRDRAGSGGQYRIDCGASSTPWIRTVVDPAAGEPWRFLVFSDHQCHPGVAMTMRAVTRLARQRPLHGLLFAGDAASIPDDPATWYGAPAGTSFLDTVAAPVEALFTQRKGDARSAPSRWPILSTLPIWVSPGNHDVSSSSGTTAQERFANVAPGDWDIATFADLFLPQDPWPSVSPDASPTPPPGCYAARTGPLQILALFVARRWVPGDPLSQTGPCFEPPGRFIFESVEPGSRQVQWLQAQVRRPKEPGMLRVLLLHHPPYAQGWNCLPLFDHPPEYATNLIARHLVPIIQPWADLVISGHNHAVNHHLVDGVHYFESSHMGMGKEARIHLPDGSPAPEPTGHTGLFFAGEEAATYFAVLEVTARAQGPRARMSVQRVEAGGWSEEVYTFSLGPQSGDDPAQRGS